MPEIYDHQNNPFEPLDSQYVLDRVAAEFLIGNLTVSGFYMREYEQLQEQSEQAEVIPLKAAGPATEPERVSEPVLIRRMHHSQLVRGPRGYTVGIASGLWRRAPAGRGVSPDR